MKIFSSFVLSVLCLTPAAAREYWTMDNGRTAIVRAVADGETWSDHLEMAGRSVASVLRYGVNSDGSFRLEKSLIWPMLRTVPNNTHASLMRRINADPIRSLLIREYPTQEHVDTLIFDGVLTVKSTLGSGIRLERTYYVSTTQPALIERYRLTNTSGQTVPIEIPAVQVELLTPEQRGVGGAFRISYRTTGPQSIQLSPGGTVTFSGCVDAGHQGTPALRYNADTELSARRALIEKLTGQLTFDCPDPAISTLFSFCKIRACESIYETHGGPMHGPGGESFYAAIWANDQAEYANPFFPFLAYDYANASAENSFRHFAHFMNDQWKPIPSSIIAEGDDIWNGAGDRGDAAMIAYGAARYALARGNKTIAAKLWPLIEWCLAYCRHKLNKDGVVASDSDELENRFPSGDANLCTSSLYYDALLSAAYLSEQLGHPKNEATTYRKQAVALAQAMDRYFSGPVEGFDTYAYYKGNDVLRAWICIPLTVGINTRSQGTIDALFSPRLWTENGLLSQAGDKTFWDRSTLYALRGVCMAGYPDRAIDFLKSYSRTRLLGAHVPYPVEAWPEGNQRHLSAESALYARIVTEGLMGIRPTGLRTFRLTPQLPAEWDYMTLRSVRAFESDFDITVTRLSADRLSVRIVKADGTVVAHRKIKAGQGFEVRL